jgi:hypothetical protein
MAKKVTEQIKEEETSVSSAEEVEEVDSEEADVATEYFSNAALKIIYDVIEYQVEMIFIDRMNRREHMDTLDVSIIQRKNGRARYSYAEYMNVSHFRVNLSNLSAHHPSIFGTCIL